MNIPKALGSNSNCRLARWAQRGPRPHLQDVLVVAVTKGDVLQLHVIPVRRMSEIDRPWPVLQNTLHTFQGLVLQLRTPAELQGDDPTRRCGALLQH